MERTVAGGKSRVEFFLTRKQEKTRVGTVGGAEAFTGRGKSERPGRCCVS